MKDGGSGLPGARVDAPALRVRGGSAAAATATLAAEVPVALEYNGVAHAVMLATPADLEDFALGFTVSEGLVDGPAEVYGVEVHEAVAGITLALDIAAGAFARLKERRRTLAGRTGCGLCGTESLAQVQRALPALGQAAPQVAPAALARAAAQLAAHQPLAAATGSVHGAAW